MWKLNSLEVLELLQFLEHFEVWKIWKKVFSVALELGPEVEVVQEVDRETTEGEGDATDLEPEAGLEVVLEQGREPVPEQGKGQEAGTEGTTEDPVQGPAPDQEEGGSLGNLQRSEIVQERERIFISSTLS